MSGSSTLLVLQCLSQKCCFIFCFVCVGSLHIGSYSELYIAQIILEINSQKTDVSRRLKDVHVKMSMLLITHSWDSLKGHHV